MAEGRCWRGSRIGLVGGCNGDRQCSLVLIRSMVSKKGRIATWSCWCLRPQCLLQRTRMSAKRRLRTTFVLIARVPRLSVNSSRFSTTACTPFGRWYYSVRQSRGRDKTAGGGIVAPACQGSRSTRFYKNLATDEDDNLDGGGNVTTVVTWRWAMSRLGRRAIV